MYIFEELNVFSPFTIFAPGHILPTSLVFVWNDKCAENGR